MQANQPNRNRGGDDGEDWKARPRIKRRKGQLTAAAGILEMALRRSGIDQDLARYRFVLHWKEIVGNEIAARTRPESINNGRLNVIVPSAAWAQELGFQKQLIIERLRRFMGAGFVLRDICFRVGR